MLQKKNENRNLAKIWWTQDKIKIPLNS